MSYYDEEEEGQLDPNAPPVIGGQSSTISGQGAAPGSGPGKTPDSPGNFVGIKQYLDANKPQASKLGDQASNVINTSADQARQSVTSLKNEADNTIKSVNSLDESVSNKLQNAAETLGDDERSTIKQTASAKYSGPKDETGFGETYTNAAKATNTAKANIDNSGTEQGRMNLITQINSKPRTQGMNVFDNTLLQSGGGREKLAQAASANQDVKTALDTTSQDIRSKIGQADEQTTAAQSDAYKKIQDAMGAWQASFDPKVEQARQALISQQNAVTRDLGDNQFGLDQGTLDFLGLQEGQNVYDVDFKNYVNQVSPDQINAGNIASEQDYARYAALADLAGVDPTVLNPNNKALAGTAPKFASDKEKLKTDLATKDKAFRNAYSEKSATEVIPEVNSWLTRSGVLNGKSMEQVENQLNQWQAEGFPGMSIYYYQEIMPTITQWKSNQHRGNVVKKNS